jgi:hypothetical protein
LEDFGGLGTVAHRVHELANDAEIHIRLEKRDPHLAQGLVEVLLGYGAVAGEAIEYALEFFAERVKHNLHQL